jgi:heterotetrameric sarcosine oxidase gamma subunit
LTQTDVRHWVLAPGHYLVTSEDTDRPKLLAKLAPMANTEAGLNLAPPIRWTDVTSVYAALLLAGPRSREILAKLTSLNVSDSSLPDGACAQSGLSHVHAVVLRQDIGGLPAFIVMVGRECAEFVWDSIMHAGHEYEMTAFGVACRSLLGGL